MIEAVVGEQRYLRLWVAAVRLRRAALDTFARVRQTH
jgi:hypothetical protein